MSERKRVPLCVRASGAMPGHYFANVKAVMLYISEKKRVQICVRASGAMPDMIQAMRIFVSHFVSELFVLGLPYKASNGHKIRLGTL